MSTLPTPTSPEGRHVIQALWDLFYATGQWPSAAHLARRLDRVHDIALEDALRSLPPGLVSGIDPRRPIFDTEVVRLTIAGAAAADGSTEDLKFFVAAIQLATELDRGWEPAVGSDITGPDLTAADLAARVTLPAAGREAVLMRVGALLMVENWGWSSGGVASEGHGWRFTITRHVRRFRGVANLEDYWGRAHPPSVSYPDPAGPSTIAVGDKRELTIGMNVPAHTDESHRNVFLVHGRDQTTRAAMIELLRAFELHVVTWREASSRAGGGTPYTGDIVRAGMEMATAVVVLLTPDDIGYVRPALREARDGLDEVQPTGQARLNVIFEAGMAMALNRARVVLVEVGVTRALSDTAGLNLIRLRNDVESRKDLAARLSAAGLQVYTEGEEWRSAGDFNREPIPAAEMTLPIERYVPHETQADRGSVADDERLVLKYLLARFTVSGATRVNTPFEVDGLEWPAIAGALRDLYNRDPRYIQGITSGQADYPVVITELTEPGRNEARRP